MADEGTPTKTLEGRRLDRRARVWSWAPTHGSRSPAHPVERSHRRRAIVDDAAAGQLHRRVGSGPFSAVEPMRVCAAWQPRSDGAGREREGADQGGARHKDGGDHPGAPPFWSNLPSRRLRMRRLRRLSAWCCLRRRHKIPPLICGCAMIGAPKYKTELRLGLVYCQRAKPSLILGRGGGKAAFWLAKAARSSWLGLSEHFSQRS
jgi:hypothetical protein